MNALTLPTVHPMMVREFTPTGRFEYFGGVLVLDTFDAREGEVVESRLSYDEDEVDCSNRIFQITNWLMMDGSAPTNVTCFPSRRWRNMREGEEITDHPTREKPLLYIGNPIRIAKSDKGISVFGRGEFIIKSGVELGY
jgi:hypothetical protein